MKCSTNLLFSAMVMMAAMVMIFPSEIQAQSVGIGTTTPAGSAILDIQSTTKGLLTSRMTTAQRSAIPAPENGLLVYDTGLGTFWYYHNAGWTELAPNDQTDKIFDADNNTMIQVEESANEDIIRFDIAGFERMTLKTNAGGNQRLELPNLYGSVYIGVSAGENSGASSYNTGVGTQALQTNTTGFGNTAIGYTALQANTTGLNNTAVGFNALNDNTTGSANTAIGTESLWENTTGTGNVAIGIASLTANTTGFDNTALGGNALSMNTTGDYNTAAGYFALRHNTTGNDNTAIGFGALFNNKANSRSTAIGDGAMGFADDRTTGRATYNTAVGYQALRGGGQPANNTGQYNTAVGDNALSVNTSGASNVAIGAGAMESNATGSSNTAGGRLAMGLNTTGLHNTAFGFASLEDNTEGFNNTAFGSAALNQNTIGDNNTGIGRSAYFTADNLNNNTAIGYLAGGVSNVSNRIEIGNASVTWIGGEVNWSTYSDARIKRNVRENVPGLDFITRLRPVTYNLDIHAQYDLTLRGKEGVTEWPEKYDIEQKQMTGFIAQEVDAAARATGYDFSGVEQAADEVGLYSVRYAEFVVPLVKAVQEQQTLISAQQLRLDEQAATIAWLTERAAESEALAAELVRLHARLDRLTTQTPTP